MKAAVEMAKGIRRKEEAIRKTKSWKLKKDLEKSNRRDKNELLFYCRSRGFTIDEVFKNLSLQTDTKWSKIDRERRETMKEELLKYRKEHAISQREMAKRAGISPTTIERIEKGGAPSTIVAGKLEKVIKEGKR